MGNYFWFAPNAMADTVYIHYAKYSNDAMYKGEALWTDLNHQSLIIL